MATVVAFIEREGTRVFKRRTVAPGQAELSVVAFLQFAVVAALIAAPDRWLRGSGTAILLMAAHPEASPIVRMGWTLIFFTAGILCVRAITCKTISARKWAWQVVIPLWMCWLSGLIFPLFLGLPTNVIMLSAVTALVTQWMVTRILVPLDSSWYSREVPIQAHPEGEGLLQSVGDNSGGSE
jgi:hypothetical protein